MKKIHPTADALNIPLLAERVSPEPTQRECAAAAKELLRDFEAGGVLYQRAYYDKSTPESERHELIKQHNDLRYWLERYEVVA